MNVQLDFKSEGECVLRLTGRFQTGSDAAYLQAKAGEVKGSGRTNVVADFADVPYLDSTGMAFLVTVYTAVTRDGGKFSLAAINPRVRKALELTNLVRILPVYDNVETALEAGRSAVASPGAGGKAK